MQQRAQLVATLAAGDAHLEQEVLSLLAHSTARDGVDTEFTANALDAFTEAARNGETPIRANAMIGQRLGSWQLTAVLGQGGMGVVYAADRVDGAYQQRAAIKLLRDGLFDDVAVALLVSERQHLARLEHANIARLLDGGQTANGTPYLVMEFVDGVPIDVYCRNAGLTLTARILLLLRVFDAVQSAHEKLIIHRDIKPANVLATALGEPKLLDFGVAKLIDATAAPSAATQQARLPFTPRYASPEQVEGQSATVRTDVYGLGMLAFELLAGDSPFAQLADVTSQGKPRDPLTPWQALDVVRKDTLRPASTVAAAALPAHAKALRGDLETVLAKALARAPADRYATVAAFAADLRAYLAGWPVRARPASRADRAWKFCKRHTVAVPLAAAATLALVATAGIATWQSVRAERSAIDAADRATALRQIARSMIFEVNDALADGTTAARGKLLATATRFLDGLDASSSKDLTLKLDTAEAFERLGDIAGNASQSNLGDAQAAAQHYDKALALRQQLLTEHPDGFVEATGMMKINQRRARMALDRGDLRAALLLSAAQADWAEKAAARKVDDVNAQLAVSEAQLNLASVHYYPGRKSLNDFSAALALVKRAVTQRAGLVTRAPADVSVVRAYAQSLVFLAQLRLVHGQAQDALDVVLRIGPVIDPLLATPATRVRAAPFKISELRHRGEALLDLGHTEAGLRSLQEAVALADTQASADSRNIFLERRAATTRSALAYQQLRAGQTEAALANTRAYLAVIEKQHAAQPDVANLKGLRDDAVTALIEALLAAHLNDEAKRLAETRANLNTLETTESTGSHTTDFFSLAQARHWQGRAFLAVRPNDARGLALVTEGAAYIARALQVDPFDANLQRTLAEQQVQFADLLATSDKARACGLFNQAHASFEALRSEQRLSAIFVATANRAAQRAAACIAGDRASRSWSTINQIAGASAPTPKSALPLNTAMSVSPRMRLVSVPAVMEPLTLSAVRPMSMSGSIEIKRPTSATGKSIAESTMSAANVAPPPTPATPIEPMVTMAMSCTMKLTVNGSMPTVGAIITASIAG